MKWQPTPVFLPGESHGPRSLVGYSPWGRKESDTTERLNHNKTPYSRWFPYHKFIFCQFWRLEVQEQDLCRSESFEASLLVFSLWSSFCVYVLISSSSNHTSHIGLGSTLITSFYLNYLKKNPISKYSHILSNWQG